MAKCIDFDHFKAHKDIEAATEDRCLNEIVIENLQHLYSDAWEAGIVTNHEALDKDFSLLYEMVWCILCRQMGQNHLFGPALDTMIKQIEDSL